MVFLTTEILFLYWHIYPVTRWLDSATVLIITGALKVLLANNISGERHGK